MEQLLLKLRAQSVSLIRTQNAHAIILVAAVLVLTLVLCTFYFYMFRNASSENNGITSYLRFAYSCFIKAHHATLDGGQQSALEGFYSTQVPLNRPSIVLLLNYSRPLCTMPRERDFFLDGRICWDSSQPSSSTSSLARSSN